VSDEKSIEDASEKPPPDFAAFLATLNKGRSNRDLSEKLATLVEAIEETGKQGSLTYTIKIKPQKAGGMVILTDEVRASVPRGERPEAVAFHRPGLRAAPQPRRPTHPLRRGHRRDRQVSDFDPLDATNAIEAVAELAHRAAAAEAPASHTIDQDDSLVVRVVPNDQTIRTVDLERYLEQPRRPRGDVTVHDPADFCTYVTRLEGTQTSVWANEDTGTVTALFNDHGETGDEDAEGLAGWRDHTATLRLKVDRDWAAWAERDGKLGSQEWFAEFLEDNARLIVEPDAATMYEVARSFQARSSADFSRVVRVDNGDVQMTWNEQTDAKVNSLGKGTFEVPASFTVRLAPFVGTPMQQLTARLRWRLREGNLAIGYALLRPDLVAREAFQDVVATVAGAVNSPVLLGVAPKPLNAAQ